MTDLYIFRHGDTKNSKNFFSRFIKRRDTKALPILPESRQALEKIGVYLKTIKTDANFTSPYLRCLESSEIVANETGKKFIQDVRLSELEGNDSFIQFHSRIMDFWNEVKAKNYNSLLICTHGAGIGALRNLAKTGEFTLLDVMNYPAPGNLMIIKDGKEKIKDFNH